MSSTRGTSVLNALRQLMQLSHKLHIRLPLRRWARWYDTVEGFDTSETSYTFSRNPENPRESPRLPAESRRIPRIPMISTPQSYQESSRILWNPLESSGIPMNPQWIPRILKNPENPQDFPPINLGNLVQNFWSVAPLVVRKLFSSTRGTIDKRAHRKRLGLTLAFCRNHFCKLYTNVLSCWVEYNRIQ